MRAAFALVLGLALASAGCHVSARPRTVSRGSPTDMPIEEVPTLGSQIVLEPRDGDRLRGELLAMDEGFVWLQDKDGKVARVARGEIDWINVETDEGSNGLVAVSALGLVSTLSHGWFLVISAPVWAATIGGVAGAEISRDHIRFEQPLELLWHYARYPQGPTPRLLGVNASPPSPKPLPPAPPSEEVAPTP